MAVDARHWLMPSIFSGAGQDFEAFVMDYETAIEANGFPVDNPSSATDEMQKMALLILKRSLSGSAFMMLRSLSDSDRRSLDAIMDALKQRFGTAGKETISQAELRSRRRLPGESVEELGDAIHLLANRSYPGVDKGVFDTITVRAFLEALPLEFRRRIGDHEPATLHDAVRKAKALEMQDMADESSLEVTIAAAQPSQIDVLVKAFERLESSQAATNTALAALCDRLDSSRPISNPLR